LNPVHIDVLKCERGIIRVPPPETTGGRS